MKNLCPFCKKAVFYPEGVYLKKGIEAHILCIQEKRKQENEKRLSNA
jgi:hypothetical protein